MEVRSADSPGAFKVCGKQGVEPIGLEAAAAACLTAEADARLMIREAMTPFLANVLEQTIKSKPQRFVGKGG